MIRHILYVSFCAVFAACNSNANDELAHHHHHGAHESEEHNHENCDHDHEGHDHEGHDHEGHEGHNHGDGDEITLHAEQAKRFGVKVAEIVPGTFNNIIKVSGQVVPSSQSASVIAAPTAGIVYLNANAVVGKSISVGTSIATVKASGVTGGDPNAAARVAVDAARREVERLEPLHRRGVVSTAEYNRAVAAYQSAKASYSPAAASGQAHATISGAITAILVEQGQFVDAGTPIATVTANSRMTLRADVPQKLFNQVTSVTNARFRTTYMNTSVDLKDLNGARTSSEQTISTTPGYIPIYFSFTNNGSIVPGSIAEVYLEGQARQNVITVPVSALSEQQGDYFVYIQLDEEGYQKVPVTIGQSDGKRTEVLSGLHKGDKVVVEGTTTVRLAEKSGVVPEGHSHSH